MKTHCITLLSVIFFSLSHAEAGLILGFSSTNLNLSVGETTLVDIVATQTDEGDLILGGDIRDGADGIFLAAARLESDSPTIASSAFVAAGPGFLDSMITPSTPTELNLESINPTVPTFAPNSDPTSLVLGTFRFTGLTAGTSTVSLVDPTIFDDWVFGNDLGGDDTAVFSNAQAMSIRVAPVPEPSSLLIMAGTIGLAVMQRQRRRNRQRIDHNPKG